MLNRGGMGKNLRKKWPLDLFSGGLHPPPNPLKRKGRKNEFPCRGSGERIFIPAKEETTGEEEDLWRRLDELEVQEALEREWEKEEEDGEDDDDDDDDDVDDDDEESDDGYSEGSEAEPAKTIPRKFL